MTYSVQNLTLVADCDAALAKAAKERADLDFQRHYDQRVVERFAGTALEIEAELQSLALQIPAQDAYIATLPEGKAKEDAIEKRADLVYRQLKLQGRKEDYGVVALLDKEMDLARVLREMEEVDGFVAEVSARKVVLESQS